jgi:hypothetical protein
LLKLLLLAPLSIPPKALPREPLAERSNEEEVCPLELGEDEGDLS